MTNRWQSLAFAALVLAFAAAPAQAKLRSPHLESSCADGFSYGEITLGQWLVEGCHKTGTPQGDETARTIFQGDVELNGMLVEGSSNLIAATSNHAPMYWRITRPGSSKLVLDPKIGGQRRRFVIYTGAVDLQLTSRITGFGESGPPIQSAGGATGGNTVDIPVGSDAKVLGMRLGGTIHDATVSATEDGGSLKLKPRMTMGSAASALLRDWVAHVDVETVDGTGMKITNLVFSIPKIEIPGIGGFDHLSVTYNESRDEWAGSVKIDLGELFPSIDFDMAISASTGAPTKIQLDVSPLNVALGPTGIFLEGVRGGFNTNPLILNSGVSLTAGPKFGGLALVQMDGDLSIQLEQNGDPLFRLEGKGDARFLVIGDSQIARGDTHVIIDSRGYLSISGNADYEVALLGVGIGADIGGSGAYSNISNVFNIEAHATGKLLLGFLGDIDVVRFGAVVSSNGWGTCGTISFFIQAGVGQEWDGNPQLLLGCDLSRFDAHVPDPGASGARAKPVAAGEHAQTFTVAPRTKEVAVEITADGPEPQAALFGPGGGQVAATVPAERFRAAGPDAAVVAPPGSATQYIFLRNPAAGRYTLRWTADGPQVTGLRFARDVAPLSAKVRVRRAGSKAGLRDVLVSSVKGLGEGERLVVGIRTPSGIMPVGQLGGRSLRARFQELAPGRHAIVGSVLRDGIPMPSRTRVLGHYTASLPTAPAKLKVKRLHGRRVALIAKARHGAELPDAWEYVLRSHGQSFAAGRTRPGHRALVTIPTDYPNLTASVRPVVAGRVLPVKPRVIRFAERHRSA